MEVNMFNNPYMQQQNLDRINDQIKQLENIRNQMQQPAPITQNFQLAPSSSIRYAKSIEEVDKSPVMGDTPFFSQDMAILWLKSASGEVKTYELKEIIKKDEKDLKIELLMAQIEEMKNNAKSNSTNVDATIKDEESTSISKSGKSNAK
jgi:hypothetical protein